MEITFKFLEYVDKGVSIFISPSFKYWPLIDPYFEDFLKKSASEIYQSVVEIFKTKLNDKLNEFINNIEKNKEANKFFSSCDVLNENKEIKLQEKILK